MKWTRYFIYSAGAILLAAAITRFVIVIGHDPVLALRDPLLGIPLLYAVPVVGGIELVIALICLLGRSMRLQLALLASWAVVGTAYFGGLLAEHWAPQITCLGSLSDPFQLHHGVIGWAMMAVPVYYVLGSLGMAVPGFLFGRREVAAATKMAPAAAGGEVWVAPLKIACPQCGGHVEFPAKLMGEKVPCPHCKAAITLEKEKSVKISCPKCDGHLEFAFGALGKKVDCPHCGTAITLNR